MVVFTEQCKDKLKKQGFPPFVMDQISHIVLAAQAGKALSELELELLELAQECIAHMTSSGSDRCCTH